jgi:3',5'-cyclic AMP phosphodiesterase CpdA
MARTLADWLDAALSRTKARWKFVVFHHPIYPSHPTREQPQLAEAWVPVFDKHKVDIVFQGHDHAYLRTYPMRGGRPDEVGTVYVVSVSGQKFVPLADRSYTARGFADVATYQTIDISPRRGTLLYRAYDVEGRERDRLEIDKGSGGAVAGRPRIDPEVRRAVGP